MGITERRQKEKSEMRRKILDAAIALFIEEGYENVSIRKIAEKIEYSPTTIYLYFEDKDSIFFELHKLGFAELKMRQLSVQHIEDPVERLLAHGREYMKFSVDCPEYYDIMFIVRSPGLKIQEDKKWEHGDSSFEILIQNVSQCQELGYFPDLPVVRAAFFLWSLMHGLASLHIRQRLVILDIMNIDIEEVAAHSIEMLRTFIMSSRR